MAFRYHLGSLAFGSFILAVVWLMQIILEVVAKGRDKYSASENKVVKCLIKSCRCCLACFEKCIRFLTESVYIRIALTGEAFCPAAKSAFFSLLSNAVVVALVTVLGGAFIYIGTLCIALTSTYFGWLWITKRAYYATVLVSTRLPTLVNSIFNIFSFH